MVYLDRSRPVRLLVVSTGSKPGGVEGRGGERGLQGVSRYPGVSGVGFYPRIHNIIDSKIHNV